MLTTLRCTDKTVGENFAISLDWAAVARGLAITSTEATVVAGAVALGASSHAALVQQLVLSAGTPGPTELELAAVFSDGSRLEQRVRFTVVA